MDEGTKAIQIGTAALIPWRKRVPESITLAWRTEKERSTLSGHQFNVPGLTLIPELGTLNSTRRGFRRRVSKWRQGTGTNQVEIAAPLCKSEFPHGRTNRTTLARSALGGSPAQARSLRGLVGALQPRLRHSKGRQTGQIWS